MALVLEGDLTDAHIVQLSERLTNYGNLRSLAYRGLRLEHHLVESATTSKQPIEASSYHLLNSWVKQQVNRRVACQCLYLALNECQMPMLAEELAQWVQNKEDHLVHGKSSSTDILSEKHILWLSKTLSMGELMQLAYGSLQLNPPEIEATIAKKQNNVSSAVNGILQVWLDRQENRNGSLNNFCEALNQCGLKRLVDGLRRVTQSSIQESQIHAYLTDDHINRLSQRLTDSGQLRSLAYSGFRLEHHQIEPIMHNRSNDIQSAAHEVIHTWLKQQKNRDEAFIKMLAALQECKMEMLATNLKQWANQMGSEICITEKSTYL